MTISQHYACAAGAKNIPDGWLALFHGNRDWVDECGNFTTTEVGGFTDYYAKFGYCFAVSSAAYENLQTFEYAVIPVDADFTFDCWAWAGTASRVYGADFPNGGLVCTGRTNATTAGTGRWEAGFTAPQYDYTSKVIAWPNNTMGHIAVIRQNGWHFILFNGKVVYALQKTPEVEINTRIGIAGYMRGNGDYVDELALRLFAAWDCTGAAKGDQVFTPPTTPYSF